MNQPTATTIVNNKIWEIVLTRFKGLPVCYADNVEEYRIYIPIIERLNRGIVILCQFKTTITKRDNTKKCGFLRENSPITLS